MTPSVCNKLYIFSRLLLKLSIDLATLCDKVMSFSYFHSSVLIVDLSTILRLYTPILQSYIRAYTSSLKWQQIQLAFYSQYVDGC